MNLLTKMRSGLWWNHLIQPLSFWILFGLIITYEPTSWQLFIFTLLILGSSCIAIMGYLINDYFDMKSDLKAAKHNFFLLEKRKFVQLIALFTTGVIGFFCWFSVGINTTTLILIIVELCLFPIYSISKKFNKSTFASLLLDTSYSRVIPSLTIISIFNIIDPLLLISSTIWLSLTGFRNILLHQIDDRKKDKISNNNTYTLRKGPISIINFIYKWILPLELLFCITSLFMMSKHVSYLWLGLVVFFVFLSIRFSVWFSLKNHKNSWLYRGLYLPNDFYTFWLPAILLAYGIATNRLNHLLFIPFLFFFGFAYFRYLKNNIGPFFLELQRPFLYVQNQILKTRS